MELNGALSNPRLHVELPPISALAGRTAKEAPRSSLKRQLSPRQGVVLATITSVLRSSQKAMRAREVWTAVEAVLNRAVPKSSVYEALSTHAREGDRRFHRVSYGVYEYRRELPSKSD